MSNCPVFQRPRSPDLWSYPESSRRKQSHQPTSPPPYLRSPSPTYGSRPSFSLKRFSPLPDFSFSPPTRRRIQSSTAQSNRDQQRRSRRLSPLRSRSSFFDMPPPGRDTTSTSGAERRSSRYQTSTSESNTGTGRGRRQRDSANFVDLTSDDGANIGQESSTNIRRQHELGTASRAPRFPNHIIDLDDEDGSTRDSEIQFLSSSRLRDLPIPQSNVRSTTNRSQIEDDGFEIIGQRQLPPQRQHPLALHLSHSLQHSGAYFGGPSHIQNSAHTANPGTRSVLGNLVRAMANHLAPIGGMPSFLTPSMDYNSVAFAYNPPIHSDPVTETTPATRYESPTPAPPGFSYTPNEKDTFVCPNCDNELRMGDTDEARQVWVVRACGHVSLFQRCLIPFN